MSLVLHQGVCLVRGLVRAEVVRMTKSQARTLRIIVELTELYGFPPSVYELADELGVAVSTMHSRLRVLERNGYLEPIFGARTYVLKGASISVSIPRSLRSELELAS